MTIVGKWKVLERKLRLFRGWQGPLGFADCSRDTAGGKAASWSRRKPGFR